MLHIEQVHRSSPSTKLTSKQQIVVKIYEKTSKLALEAVRLTILCCKDYQCRIQKDKPPMTYMCTRFPSTSVTMSLKDTTQDTVQERNPLLLILETLKGSLLRDYNYERLIGQLCWQNLTQMMLRNQQFLNLPLKRDTRFSKLLLL